MDNISTLNIQPDASIYGIFSRLNYKIWFAIAEFVDNSTASFFKYERVLKFHKIYKCKVFINYNEEQDLLTIKDDAYGMELHDFERAIKLDQKPEHIEGRNEFGMGLKTAASWFGNLWSVESTQLGSVNKYYAEVNIPLLKDTKSNNIQIMSSRCEANQHGTIITIRQLTKKIEGGRTLGKIKDIIRSMYRRDINSKKIEIFFNEEQLFFEPYDILNFNSEEWKKTLKFSFMFNDHQYNVTGFVGILGEKSSGFIRAGFGLFRRNRIIIGSEGNYYKPSLIFGQSQSKISHKLFGEFDLDDFPINQSKDGFIWDDGLETAFLTELKRNILDYIKIADMKTKDLNPKVEIDTKDQVEFVINDVNKALKKLNSHDYEADLEGDDLVKEFLEQQDQIVIKEKILVDSVHHYDVPINRFETIKLCITWTHTGDEYWFKRELSKDSEWNIKVNVSHPFFEPFYYNEEFKPLIEKFIISFLLSSDIAKKTSDKDGYVLPSVFENQMNRFLAVLVKN